MKLRDKVAIITGASRSIGRAIAIEFARQGAKVVVNYYKNKDLAVKVVKEIQNLNGSAIAIQGDVSKEAEVNAMIESTLNHFKRIDILVNNAAIDPRKEWNEISGEEWDRVMEVNVKSQFLCSKAVYPSMLQQGWGKIINISSVTFFTGQRNYVHYVASKGAVIGFTRALSRELGGEGVTVNCVSLGAILTETEREKVGTEERYAEVSKKLIEFQAIPKRLTVEDVLGTFVFLASSGSDSITGQTFNVDGGWIMH